MSIEPYIFLALPYLFQKIYFAMPRKIRYIEKIVDPQFAHNIVGFHIATRQFAHKALWTYIDEKNLFTNEEKKYFMPNEYLGHFLGSEIIRFPEGANKFLSANLFDLPNGSRKASKRDAMGLKSNCPVCLEGGIRFFSN